MIFGRTKTELKVGLFLAVGLLVLVTFVLFIGRVRSWTSGYRVKFSFTFVNGIKMGAPVRFAGVDVGEVRAVSLRNIPAESKTVIELTCWIKKGVSVPVDSVIWINTLGLLGEKYIEIIPGKNYLQYLGEGQTLAGVDPIPLHEMAQLAKDIATNLEEMIVKIRNKEGTLGRLVYDDTLYKELEASLLNRSGTLGRFIYDDTLYRDIEAFVTDIRNNPWKLFFHPKPKPAKKR